ncbi:hypothetical protein E2C01_070460 [Portunus trituberculatus]|uniref:Uncharacterized protein n=1 Tax=Portunus trituberculatus TaxID=210409 RepID=A0A5B7I2C2_PORTR|nr:hypothetical protein [Portunus trituberculatus]
MPQYAVSQSRSAAHNLLTTFVIVRTPKQSTTKQLQTTLLRH